MYLLYSVFRGAFERWARWGVALQGSKGHYIHGNLLAFLTIGSHTEFIIVIANLRNMKNIFWDSSFVQLYLSVRSKQPDRLSSLFCEISKNFGSSKFEAPTTIITSFISLELFLHDAPEMINAGVQWLSWMTAYKIQIDA